MQKNGRFPARQISTLEMKGAIVDAACALVQQSHCNCVEDLLHRRDNDMANDSDDLGQFDRIMQTLRSTFDLKERGALTDADYDDLKGRLLKRLESMETVAHPPQPLEGVLNLPPLEMYAADFHRMMVQQMYQEYPGAQGDQREYMQRMISMLAQQQALRPSDMPHMRMMVDTVCDNTFGESIDRLMEGAAKLQSIHNQVRLNAETSRLAKTVSGIAHNSAQNAVFGIEQAAPQAAAMPKTEPARGWGIVKEDTNGALSGAGLALGITTIPGAAVAVAAVASALGPAMPILGVLGALVGAGVISGMEWARTKTGS